MRRRIADYLEKMSVGFLVGAYFQESSLAAIFSVLSLGYCLSMTRRLAK